MKTQAKIFTILQFYADKKDEKIVNRVHYVAATCSEEAEDIFKEDFGRINGFGQSGQFWALTDEAMARNCESGLNRCLFYVDNRHSPDMTQAEYTRWILAYSRRLWNEDRDDYEAPTYRRIYA